MSTIVQRRMPMGAEPAGGGVHFRVWAPRRKRVSVVLEGSRALSLEPEGNGYFSSVVESATIMSSSIGETTPWRAMRRARSVGDKSAHSGRQMLIVAAAYDSVRPYPWVMSNPRFSRASINAAAGAAPPVKICTRCESPSRSAEGALQIVSSTVGAPHMCVTFSDLINEKIRSTR